MKIDCGVVRYSLPVALALAAAPVAVHAADAGAPRAETPSYGMFGDWLGLKPAFARHGVELEAKYGSQGAYNLSGGDRKTGTAVGQFTFGASVDMETLAGIEGGTMRFSFTRRHGEDLGAHADLGVAQSVQEVFGRGNIWRLTEAWYDQKIGPVDLKFGRMTVGGDFATFDCDFQNLTFCGAQAGNMVGAYWFNWPVSQWAARLKAVTPDGFYGQVGVYAVDEENLTDGFSLDSPFKAQGALIPAEIGWVSPDEPGRYKTKLIAGFWGETSRAPDLLDGESLRRGRYGGYAIWEQELFRPDPSDPARNVTGFARGTIADRRTAFLQAQTTVGLAYHGWSTLRPKDAIALALGLNWINSRAGGGTERVMEVYYDFQATPWLALRPNFQLIGHPSGQSDRDLVTVVGLKSQVTF